VSKDNWGSRFMQGFANGINELFAKFWTIVILLVFYAFLCAALSTLTGLDPMIFFWGLPVFIIVVSVVLVVLALSDSGKKGGAKSGARVTTTGARGIPADSKPTDDVYYRESLSLLKRLAASDQSSAKVFSGLAEYILRELPLFSHSKTLESFEGLFLAVTLRKSKPKAAVHFLIDSCCYQPYIDYKESETAALLFQKIFELHIAQLNDDDADGLLKVICEKHVRNIVKGKAKKFPTQSSLLNVLAIPQGSFLEKEAAEKSNSMKASGITDQLTVPAMRELADEYSLRIGSDLVDNLLSKSLALQKKYLRSRLEKELQKASFTATNVNNVRRWSAELCYTEDFNDIRDAHSFATKAISKVTTKKMTKAMQEAMAKLEAFEFLPKGIADMEAEEIVVKLSEEFIELQTEMGTGLNNIDQDFYERSIKCAEDIIGYPQAMVSFELGEAVSKLLIQLRLNLVDVIPDEQASAVSARIISLLKTVEERK
jgi:hypothetical protein